ncbi:hypothetical protein J2S58_002101 [Nakamurella flavida]|uniref:glycosyltransferase family 39 protein n=1 Tax=Nakamurella flavida TaxID=363630 RepID=UPI0027844372|nr:glycosyltransferase family 39 protein [Nakamurella flavida]MDP9778478.1 hypothetical protein [Nakamurella flavida]
MADVDTRTRAEVTGRALLLAAIPPIVLALLVRIWVAHTSLLALNSDETLVGLQAREAMDGTFYLMVAGNDYGSTTESYLLIPFLLAGGGAWPLRLLAGLLWAVVAFLLYRTARPLIGPAAAAVVGVIALSVSGAILVVTSRPYMGYPTGMIAMVGVLALAGRAMHDDSRLPWIAGLAGLATGFAVWSHPMFGVVCVLALLPPTLRHWRRLLGWALPGAIGAVVGVSPWLVYIQQRGLPAAARSSGDTTYLDRLVGFFVALLPRAFGLRLPRGEWLWGEAVTPVVAGVIVVAAVTGWIVLLRRCGSAAAPVVFAGVAAFPVLATFGQLEFVDDARYALPFLPMLLVGLGGWLAVLPQRWGSSAWSVTVVPTAWVLLFCVPILVRQAGWAPENPDRAPIAAVRALEDRGVTFLRGDYWAIYLMDYLADGSLVVRPDFPIRLLGPAADVEAADPAEVALVYGAGAEPSLLLPAADYEILSVGGYDLYLPPGVR